MHFKVQDRESRMAIQLTDLNHFEREDLIYEKKVT